MAPAQSESDQNNAVILPPDSQTTKKLGRSGDLGIRIHIMEQYGIGKNEGVEKRETPDES